MITSPDNEKLKTVRKLRQKKHREALGLFVTEGEDLMEAGLARRARYRRRCWSTRMPGSKASRSSRPCWTASRRSGPAPG